MTHRLSPGRPAGRFPFLGTLVLIVLLLPGLAWSDPDPENPLPAVQIHFQQGDLVAIGSVPPSEWDPYGSQTPQVDYASLVAGGYKDKVIEVDCRPFSFEKFSDGTYRYFAYGTDDTGFGWREGEPILLVSSKPLPVSVRGGTLDAVAVPSGVEDIDLFNADTGDAEELEIPVLEVLSGS